MSEHIREPGYCLDQAIDMASKGYKIVPIAPGAKYPKLRAWQEEATDDLATVAGWMKGNNGVGWAMGNQPNGMHLFALDIDGEVGGTTFIALVSEHPESVDTFKRTVQQVTGSDGAHYVFQAPFEVRNSAQQFAEKIDIRGEGGQIVVGPTIHPNGKPYRWFANPVDVEPLMAPEWVLERIEEMGRTEPRSEVPSGTSERSLPVKALYASDVSRGTDDDPTEYANALLDPATFLHKAGWQYMENRGQDMYWCRPGKDPRGGHSAILHPSGVVTVFTTTLDPVWHSIGRSGKGGTVLLTPFDLYCVVEHGGDVKGAMSFIRRTMMPQRVAPAPRMQDEEAGTHSGVDAHAADVSLNLPDEFWASRDWLGHIRDAAYSRRVSPDALFAATMARYACLVPPDVQIPAIIGSTSTFDFISCVVAKSAGGKTIANGVAEELIHTTDERFLMSAPIGSGEGLIQAFMGREKDEKGKPTGDPSYKFGVHKAVHFVADEATALMEQNARKGTTIVQTLCSAWSGATLGQLNASEETKRIVPGKKRRVTACLNIQTLRGHELLADHLKAVGFPQRILFSWAHSPLPASIPAWPGPIKYRVYSTGSTLEYAPEIVSEVQDEREAVMEGRLVLDDLDGHQTLLRLKLAGLMAMFGGSTTVTVDDWALAGSVLSTHRNVRQQLIIAHRQTEGDARHRQAEARGVSDYVAETVKEKRLVDDVSRRIIARVEAAEDDGVPYRELRNSMANSRTRDRWDHALEVALATGKIERRGGQLCRTV